MDNTTANRILSMKFTPKINKLFFWYAFFMAFPNVVLVQNISVFFFLFIVYRLIRSGYGILNFKTYIQKFALIFAIGALASTIGSYSVGGAEQLSRSLIVLPNYIYWAALIVFLIRFRNKLDFKIIFSGITYGLILSIIFFFFIKQVPIHKYFPVLKGMSQNSFAFLLICFTPIAVYYIKKTYSNLWTLFFIFIVVIVSFISGSRSGSVLVFVGSFLTYFLSGQFRIKNIILTAFAGLILFAFIVSDIGKSVVYSLNPETYDLIYSTQETFETDLSYLTRVILVEKGLYLFFQNPLTGIGLNSFASTYGEISGNFEGAEFAVNKGFEVGYSAHNSYLSILTEGGLLLIIPFVLILLTLILHFILNVGKMPAFYRPVFIGVITMSVHLYFISAILNVYAWFLLALAAALTYREKEKNIKRHLKQLDKQKNTIREESKN